jgi:serine/threonine protein kinase
MEASRMYEQCKASFSANNVPKSFEKTDKLGKGENGTVYSMPKPGQVVKITKKPVADDQLTQVMNETCIGQDLGELGISPKIYDFGKTEDNRFFIVMQKMDGVWRDVFPSEPSKTREQEQMISQVTNAFEEKLIRVLKRMINAGVIHNDTHPGNIGIVGEEVVIFDWGFGFIDQRSVQDNRVRRWILVAHLYMFIEHMERTLLDNSLVYQRIHKDITELLALDDAYKAINVTTQSEALFLRDSINYINSTYSDICVAAKEQILIALCYYYFENTNAFHSFAFYNRDLYNLIYILRQGGILHKECHGPLTLSPYETNPWIAENRLVFMSQQRKRPRRSSPSPLPLPLPSSLQAQTQTQTTHSYQTRSKRPKTAR